MFNKIIAVCWFFIAGVVLATVKTVPIEYVTKLYLIFGIIFLIAIIISFLKKKSSLTIPSYITILLFIIAMFILGYTRYIHSSKITDKNHISNFAEKGWGKEKIEIEGIVSAEPDIFEDKTRVTLTPLTYTKIESKENPEPVKISGGDVLVQVKKLDFQGKENQSWSEISTLKIFGAKVKVRGKLLEPPVGSNPGTLDWSENLKAFGYYGVMWNPEIDIERDVTGKMIKMQVDNVIMDWVTNFALDVKEKILKVIRQTMPFPESAFLGGVTLGLKRGLSGKPCIKNSYYDALFKSQEKDDPQILEDWAKKYNSKKEVCDEFIEWEFRWAGVSHVLAVSGLHVSIITVLLVGIVLMLKIPKKIYPIIVIFALIVFCIITGSPPSSTRAVIMNSIALITMVYGGKGLKSSILFTIPVAAFLILVLNPTVIYQPSFTLSFGAVLSLGLLTGPCEYYLRKLRGLGFWFTIFYLAFVTFFANNYWFIFKSTIGLTAIFALYFVILFFLNKIDKDYPIFGTFGFNNIPLWLRGFIGAQFAIQLGMMTPLSSFYFGRMPIAGPYANLIAIPLIGVIVQLGMFAGLIGMIPYIGIYIALLLNASNFILCRFFLLIAHYSKEWFQYPAVPLLTINQLLFYYAIILIFVWHMKIIAGLKRLFFTYNIFTDDTSQKKITYSLIGLAVVLFGIGAIIVTPTYHKKFNITNLSTGFSSASFVELPDKTFWLIDGAININGEPMSPFSRRDEGIQTVLQFLLRKRATKLDGVILTSLEKEHLTGLISLMNYIEIKNIYDQVEPESVDATMKYEEFLDALNNDYLKEKSNKKWVKEYYTNYMDYLYIIKKHKIKHFRAKEGDVIYNKNYNGKKISITILNPPAAIEDKFYKLTDNDVIVKFEYGKNSILFTGDNSYNVIKKFKDSDNLNLYKTDILVYPNHGYLEFSKKSELTLEQSVQDLLNVFEPKYIVVQYSSPMKILGRIRARTFKKNVEETKSIILNKQIKYYNTNDDMAIISESNGESFLVKSYKEIRYGTENIIVGEDAENQDNVEERKIEPTGKENNASAEPTAEPINE